MSTVEGGMFERYCDLCLVSSNNSNTDKPVYNGHPREVHYMVFIENWSLFVGYIVLFNQGRVTEVWPLFTWKSLFRGSL